MTLWQIFQSISSISNNIFLYLIVLTQVGYRNLKSMKSHIHIIKGVLTDMDREITLEAPGDAHSVTVTFHQMAYLGLWHWPKTDAPYVCIEPWCSLPARAGRIAVFEEQEDLIALAPGQTYRNCWTISIT